MNKMAAVDTKTFHAEKDIRQAMSSYWENYSVHANKKEMLLNYNAEAIAELEEPELLGLLPCLDGKDVVELGAGIGRFTTLFAKSAQSVMAVDFMKSFVEKNMEVNGHRTNATFLQADITKMDLSPDSADVIFSNWLLMYLSDEEVQDFMQKALIWLRRDGFMFFRESTSLPQKNRISKTYIDLTIPNPTKYRSALDYLMFALSAKLQSEQDCWGFELVQSQRVNAHLQVDGQDNQVCWLLQKVPQSNGRTQQSIKDGQKSILGEIHQQEQHFGQGFLNPNGIPFAEKLSEILKIRDGDDILDIGCGIGGSAFYISKMQCVNILGLDTSFMKVHCAWQKAIQLKHTKIQFKTVRLDKFSLPQQSFDAIYNNDMAHIENKVGLIKNFSIWLKPGGKLLFTDYCSAETKRAADFTNHAQHELLTCAEYHQILAATGFVKINIKDETSSFLQNMEIHQRNEGRSNGEIYQKDEQNDSLNQWNQRVELCRNEKLKWVWIYAEKPEQ